jgi:hypothetical protein
MPAQAVNSIQKTFHEIVMATLISFTLKTAIYWFFVFALISSIATCFGWPIFILLSLSSLPKCDIETVSTLINLSGLDFEMTSIICFNHSLKVFVSDTGTNAKTLLFEFSPILIDDDGHYIGPSVNVLGHDIYFHIERVAQVFSEQEQWNDYHIHYQIDYIPGLGEFSFDANGNYGSGKQYGH